MTIDEGFVRDLRAAVAAGRDTAIGLLFDLVAEDSTLGHEQGAQARMEAEFRALGLAIDRFEPDPEQLRGRPGFSPPVLESYAGRENVVGVHRPRNETGRSLILNGHIDVVPAGPADLWTAPPFQPSIRDGRVYGRGAGDMKAGITAYCAAFRAISALGLQPAATVTLQSVIEEECTGNGALACLARGYRADAAIIPEPFDQTLMVGQLGVLWMTLRVVGRPAHVLDTSAGINAIEAAYALYDGLRALEAEWNEPDVRHPLWRDHPHPVNFNLGRLEGGEWASSVPTVATMQVRIGFQPGIDVAAAKSAVEARIAAICSEKRSLGGVSVAIDYRGFQAEPCVVDPAEPLMAELADIHELVAGRPPAHYASTATTDARFFVLNGAMPATCYGPVGGNFHGLDEWVSIDSMMQVAEVLAIFIARWCGIEKR